MEKVYIKTKKGEIFECYVSEQMNKPIYYPVDSKTNGYIDYHDVERFLEIDSMYREVKQLKQEKQELIKKPKVIVQNKLEEITEEYHKLDKKNLNTANIIAHQYNSMRTVLEEVLERLGEKK